MAGEEFLCGYDVLDCAFLERAVEPAARIRTPGTPGSRCAPSCTGRGASDLTAATPVPASSSHHR